MGRRHLSFSLCRRLRREPVRRSDVVQFGTCQFGQVRGRALGQAYCHRFGEQREELANQRPEQPNSGSPETSVWRQSQRRRDDKTQVWSQTLD